MTNTASGLRKSAAVALSAVGLATLGAAIAPAMASAATPATVPTAAQARVAHAASVAHQEHLAHLHHLHVLHVEHLAKVAAERAAKAKPAVVHRTYSAAVKHSSPVTHSSVNTVSHVVRAAKTASTTSVTSYAGMSAQAIAASIVPADQLASFSQIISHESGWSVTATNPSSGAYGLAQALPGSKMASVGSDWQTNPVTQIKWALSYMNSTYGSPNAAWAFWQTHHWY